MAGDVHLRQCLIDDVRAAAVQLVDNAADALLVAGNGRGGDNHRVALPDLQLAVLAVCHARQACHRLALAARRHHQNLAVRVLVKRVRLDDGFRRNPQFANLHRHAADVDHAASDEADAAAVAQRVVNDHLHTVDVRREHGDNHTPLRVAEHVLERHADFLFGPGDNTSILTEFAENLDGKPLSGSGDVVRAVGEGRKYIGVTLEETALKGIAAGYDIEIVYPEEGTSALPDGTAIVAGCAHRDNAELFIDFLLSSDMQTLLHDSLYRRSVCESAANAGTDEITLIDYDLEWASAEQTGLLASLNSVAKLPYEYALDGISNTQTINPSALGNDDEQRTQNLVNVLDGYFANGAHHLNVNVFGVEKLKDAMEHPEKPEYANFTIRVSGYAVKFIDLTREQQLDVISRTCHERM